MQFENNQMQCVNCDNKFVSWVLHNYKIAQDHKTIEMKHTGYCELCETMTLAINTYELKNQGLFLIRVEGEDDA